MRISRRTFVASAATPLLAAGERVVYAGTYTGPNSKGIYAWRFRDGKATSLGVAGETPNPSFLAIHPNGRNLYAANETKEGSVTAFSIDRASGMLTTLNTVASKGSGPCYVSVDKTGRNVLVANYGGGSIAVLPVEPKDGRLKEASAHVEHSGKSVHPKRQTKAYAHCIRMSPDNRFALVADLGMDQILVYAFDPVGGTLKLVREAKLPPGAGPRHMAFHPKGRMLYVNGELNSTINAFAWDNGELYARQTLSTLPAGYSGDSTTAETAIDNAGKWLYVSNRGHDSIARFSVDGKGQLAAVDHTPTGGKVPRNFSLDPDGKYLLAANQRTDNIVIFRLEAGKPVPTGEELKVSAPVCVRWL